MGKCYRTLNDYLEATFGSSYKEDDNVKIMEAAGYSPQYKWVIDLTPGTNVTRTLISLRENNSACVVLVAPFASSIRVEPSKTGMPIKITTTDTPAPGYPTTEIQYSLTDSGVYEPTKCSEIRKRRKKLISCEKAFSE